MTASPASPESTSPTSPTIALPPPTTSASSKRPEIQFPPHNAPRVWFLTNFTSPVAIALARQVLDHGDYVVGGVLPSEFDKDGERGEELRSFLDSVRGAGDDGDADTGAERNGDADGSGETSSRKKWRERLRVVGLDAR